MKKLILILLFLLCICNVSFALITTDNVDKDRFLYETGFTYATTDLGKSLTAAEVTVSVDNSSNNYYLIKRTGNDTVNGRIVGISVAGSAACTAGAATFDVTINGSVTGIQAVIQPTTIAAVGNTGSEGATYTYMNQDRADDASSQGFRSSVYRNSYHDANHVFGRATPLSAGNRIGIKVTTTSDFAPVTADYIATVYVLQ